MNSIETRRRFMQLTGIAALVAGSSLVLRHPLADAQESCTEDGGGGCTNPDGCGGDGGGGGGGWATCYYGFMDADC